MSKKQQPAEKSINFMSQRFVAIICSAILLVASLGSLAINGLNFGLDFTGGLQVEARYENPADLEQVRDTLAQSGISDAVVVFFGSDRDLKITTQQSREGIVSSQLAQQIDGALSESITLDIVRGSDDPSLPQGGLVLTFNQANAAQQQAADQVFSQLGLKNYRVTPLKDTAFTIVSSDGLQTLTELLLVDVLEKSTDGSVNVKRTEFVGPQIGDELRDQGGIGMMFALAVVMLYVAMRFQFKFSVAAVAALVHDVLIVLGFFSLTGLDFDLTVLAAVLAVIGYSLNDTIVVSDRIRENFRKIRKSSSTEVVNISLTQTLGRTLVTSLTTMLVLLALFFVGGELIHAFSIALIIGIFIGTYSSIYVAANILLFMNITKEDLIVPVKEGAEFDEMP